MKIIHLSTLWDILKFKHHVVFLFKGPAFFYIPFKISKIKQSKHQHEDLFLHFSWLEVKGKSDLSLKTLVFADQLTKRFPTRTGHRRELRRVHSLWKGKPHGVTLRTLPTPVTRRYTWDPIWISGFRFGSST